MNCSNRCNIYVHASQSDYFLLRAIHNRPGARGFDRGDAVGVLVAGVCGVGARGEDVATLGARQHQRDTPVDFDHSVTLIKFQRRGVAAIDRERQVGQSLCVGDVQRLIH